MMLQTPLTACCGCAYDHMVSMAAQHQGLGGCMQRQKEMVKHLYHECMSLEELLEESVNTLGPDARDILAQVR